ncbi:hypothetical protein HRI_000711300 [Hibiscus trionum]|uniref:Reverse transcriptase domain-containing protein n=1 Tax=Hibiscus trionum TaxID=183268 RepID=A0A9W7H6U2_HIBTR|nr:hypothetical protein HRI_000711300 [Hibiscus trionum]
MSKSPRKWKGYGLGVILRKSKRAIKSWVERERARKENTSIVTLEKQMNRLVNGLAVDLKDVSIMGEIKKVRLKLWELHRKEEREWKQKSRSRWIVDGNRNTKFYHHLASSRRQANWIHLFRVNGKIISEEGAIHEEIKRHFTNVYNSSSAFELADLEFNIRTLSSTSKSWLEWEFDEEEVWSTIRSMNSEKSPDPNGFNVGFFKKYWAEMKSDVMKFFSDFCEGRQWEPDLNHSFVCLIPKKASPEMLDDFRPIGLVGCIYKILAKVLANCLSNCLEDIISDNQFAFTKGRQILDCCLVANEVVDCLRRRGNEFLVFKADFQKAYDTVD